MSCKIFSALRDRLMLIKIRYHFTPTQMA